jgi:hypothetical protein
VSESNEEEVTPSKSEADTQVARGDLDAVPTGVDDDERGPHPIPKLHPARHEELPEMGEPTSTTPEAQE